ncbi:MAG: cob(I)yrinic acid a,c-diamide adenosyltransferase [Acidobacteria bacterium]|nr:cob(I)yrinic acid a,c-diamide adenosyltransferase [Acidobacteriota bacterium]
MSDITTKTGDGGFSSLYSGERALKSDAVFEALGVLDELNSWLGVVKLKLKSNGDRKEVETIQRNIFKIASNVATAEDSDLREKIVLLVESDLKSLEAFGEELFGRVDMPKTFVIPGVTEDAAMIDVARTICRRAERRLVSLMSGGMIWISLDVKYINRLSDILYVQARQCEEGKYQEKK